MAGSAYSHLISETTLDNLLAQYNSVISTGYNASIPAVLLNTGGNVLSQINASLFKGVPPGGLIPYEQDTTNGGAGVSVSPTTSLFFEYGSSSSTSPLDFNPVGNDVVWLSGESSTYFVDEGTKNGNGGDIIVGANANQYIQVTDGNNEVVAGSGYDTLVGGTGNDVLIGGGNSSVQGGSGTQTLFGGLDSLAHDTLQGGDGKDFLEAFQGSNLLMAGAGKDTLISGSGNNTLIGGSGTDSMVGGKTSLLEAGSGATTMIGGQNHFALDTLVGGSGPDYISVFSGNNVIAAGSGSDSIYSGDRGYGTAHTGGDIISLTAGGNANVTIGPGTATDTVYFGDTIGNDTIHAHGNVDIEVEHEQISSVDSNNGITVLTFADGQTLQYQGTGHVHIDFH